MKARWVLCWSYALARVADFSNDSVGCTSVRDRGVGGSNPLAPTIFDQSNRPSIDGHRRLKAFFVGDSENHTSRIAQIYASASCWRKGPDGWSRRNTKNAPAWDSIWNGSRRESARYCRESWRLPRGVLSVMSDSENCGRQPLNSGPRSRRTPQRARTITLARRTCSCAVL